MESDISIWARDDFSISLACIFADAHADQAVGPSGTILATRNGGAETAAMRSSLRLPSAWHLGNFYPANQLFIVLRRYFPQFAC
jgi:hypothetical protein